MGVFLWVLVVFVNAVAACLLGSVWCRCMV